METIENLKFDKKNFNKHTEYGMSLLEKSLRQNGAGRSVLVDRDNNIIAGNGIVEAAVNAGITKTRVVEVTGDELVVVRRTDLELDSKQGREMALADNATAAADLAWNYDELQRAVDEFGLDAGAWGVKLFDDGKSFFNGERNGERNDEYNEFEEKFKPKLTTDDCYTPPEVYAEVEKYVRGIVGSEPQFVRPFYPGGDYQKFNYPANCVVVDNPPFSIYAEIVRWYIEHDIKFFIFAPALTQVVSKADVNYCITSADVIYENGANVRTSFTTNLLGDIAFMTTPKLKEDIEKACKKETAELPQYSYPQNVATTALMSKLAMREFKVKKSECYEIANLDALKEQGKSLYGKGWLLNDKKADEQQSVAEEAKKASIEKNIIREQGIEIKDGKVVLTLSSKEKNIINSLNNNELPNRDT